MGAQGRILAGKENNNRSLALVGAKLPQFTASRPQRCRKVNREVEVEGFSVSPAHRQADSPTRLPQRRPEFVAVFREGL